MEDQRENHTKMFFIIAVVFCMFWVSAVICCFGGPFILSGTTLLGLKVVTDKMEKTYYAECEYLKDDAKCRTCCDKRGHSGSAFSTLVNDDNKTCGCLSLK